MYCPNCGTETKEQSVFCHSCGTRLPSNQPQDESTQTFASAPSPTNKSPMSPVIGLLWSLLLTPIAGAIVWSINWKRLGQSDKRLWTWLTAISSLIIYAVLAKMGFTWLGLIVVYAWDVWMYFIQKKATTAPLRARKVVWVCSIILAVVEFVLAFPIYKGPGSPVTVGTSYDSSTPMLYVSGSNLKPLEPLYARITSNRPFNSANMEIILNRQQGAGWQSIDQQTVTISPGDDVYVEPFDVTLPGTYQIEAIINNKTIDQGTFVVNR